MKSGDVYPQPAKVNIFPAIKNMQSNLHVTLIYLGNDVKHWHNLQFIVVNYILV